MPEKFSVLSWLKNSLREEFPKTVRKNRNIIIGVGAIFFIAIGIGFFAQIIGNNPINQFLMEWVDPLYPRPIFEKTYFEWVSFILGINLPLAFLSIVLGPAFGIFPLFSILNSGVTLGFLTAYSTIPASGLLSALFPVAVFEFPGLILAASCGIILGRGSLKSLVRRDSDLFKNAGEDAIHLVIPSFLLLVVGGFVEGLIMKHYYFIQDHIFLQFGLIGISFIPLVLLILWMKGKLI